MPDEPSNVDPIAILRDLTAWLKAEGVAGIVIGGVAASPLGRPRATRDLDHSVLVDEERWPGFLDAARQFGVVAREEEALGFARQHRVLVLHHAATGLNVDVALAQLPFEKEAILHARVVVSRGIEIPLPTPEDLIVMKAVTHRPRDLADIEAVIDANPILDRRYLRRWLREFSAALEMPEIAGNVERMLRRQRKPGH